MQKGSWPTDFRPVMDVLSQAKDKGRVRAIGVSCHGIEPLRRAAGRGTDRFSFRGAPTRFLGIRLNTSLASNVQM